MIKILKRDLVTALDDLNKITSQRTTLKTLRFVLFENVEGGIKVSATNLKLSKEFVIKGAKGSLAESFCLPNDILLQYLKACNDEDVLFNLNVQNKMCLIKADETEMNVSYLQGNEFTKFDVSLRGEVADSFTVNSDVFRNAILNTSYAASNKETEYEFNCVTLQKVNSDFVLYATNRRRINKFTIKNVGYNEGTFKVSLALSEINAVADFLVFCGENVRVNVYEKFMEIVSGDNRMNVRVLDNANSLNISDFIPDYKKFFGMLLVNKEEFSRMVRKILILFQRDFAKVVFGLERYWIRSKITNQAFGSMNDSIQVLSNNKTVPVYLGLNPVYISDVLKGYEEGLVRVYYKDNVSPIIMDFNKEEYDFMALIMPMRVD